MDAVTLFGWFGLLVAAIVILRGAWAILGELAFRASWKWGNARQALRSVKLGWNTGEPPEGALLLIREYADQLAKDNEFISNHRWAVMVCREGYCHSINGGFSTPVTNIHGWMLVSEIVKTEATPND